MRKMRRTACLFLVALATASVQAFVRPETTRVYLHGPLSERMAVLWREGLLSLGEVVHDDDWLEMPYRAQQAGCLRLVVGEEDRMPGWESARWLAEDPERPVEGIVFREGEVELRMEAAVPFGRRESVQGRLACTNRGAKDVDFRFAIVMRSGQEAELVFGTPDLYEFYDPVKTMEAWKDIPKTWFQCQDESLIRDGARFVRFGGNLEGRWDATNRMQRFEAILKPGESRAVEFAFGIGHAVRADFAGASARARADWRRELDRARDRSPLMKRLLVQMLQCFSRPTEGDFALPRQGGQQRYVWPGEAELVTDALARLGYGEYARMACDFLMRFAKPDGRIGPFANGWASDTARSLAVFARYCAFSRDADCWRAYRGIAEKAVDWIESMRVNAGDPSGDVAGLFPTLKSTDSHRVFQNWAMTDLVNEMALRELVRAAAAFGDSPLAEKCRAQAEDYRRVISGIMDRWRKENEGKDTFRIPFAPDGRLEDELSAAHFFFMHPGEFVAEGYVRSEDLERCRNWLLAEGVASEEGLYVRHVSPRSELGAHIWYTTWSEYRWFQAWMKAGRADRARQALDALLRYSVTDEGIVGERIHDENRWFWPWSPNASGAARIALMLLQMD